MADLKYGNIGLFPAQGMYANSELERQCVKKTALTSLSTKEQKINIVFKKGKVG